MDKIDGNGNRTGSQSKQILIPLLILLFIIAISVGIYYFYQHYPSRINELRTYGYLGAFLLSLIFNATVILPAGNILVISALGAVLPSVLLVGLAGGAGAAIGEISGYIAGYSGRRLIGRGKLYGRVEGWVERWGIITIFIFALMPLIFDLAGIAAGVLRFPFWKFLLVCWLGRTLLYVVFALAGEWGWGPVLRYLV